MESKGKNQQSAGARRIPAIASTCAHEKRGKLTLKYAESIIETHFNKGTNDICKQH